MTAQGCSHQARQLFCFALILRVERTRAVPDNVVFCVSVPMTDR